MADVKISALPATTTLSGSDLLPVVLPGAAVDQRSRKITVANAGKALGEYAEKVRAQFTRLASTSGVSVMYTGLTFGSGATPGVAFAMYRPTASALPQAVYCETFDLSIGPENNIWRRFGSGEVVATDFSNSETVLINTVRAYTIAGAVRLWRATANLNPLSFPPSNQVPAPGTGPQWQELSPSQAPPGAPKYFVYNSELYGLLDSQSGGTGVEPGTLYEVVDAIGGAVVLLAIGAYQLHPLAVQGLVTGGYDLVTTVFTPDPASVYPVAPFVVVNAAGTGAVVYTSILDAYLASGILDGVTVGTIVVSTNATIPDYITTSAAGSSIVAENNSITLSTPENANINIRAKKIICSGNPAITQPGVRWEGEISGNVQILGTANVELICRGRGQIYTDTGASVTLTGHWSPPVGAAPDTLVFIGTGTVYLKNATFTGAVGAGVKIIDLDGMGRSTPVDMPASIVYGATGTLYVDISAAALALRCTEAVTLHQLVDGGYLVYGDIIRIRGMAAGGTTVFATTALASVGLDGQIIGALASYSLATPYDELHLQRVPVPVGGFTAPTWKIIKHIVCV